MDGRAEPLRPFAFLSPGFFYAGRVIRSRYAILALLTALNLINYLDRYVVVTVGPRIQESLNIGDASFGWFSPDSGWVASLVPIRDGLIVAYKK